MPTVRPTSPLVSRSADVLGVSDGLKVEWVHAGSIPADVVDLVSVGDNSTPETISETM